MTPEFIRLPDRDALARRLADDLAGWLRTAVAERGSASLVIPGGTTPGPLFDRLSACDLPWDRVVATLGDERWVDPSDPASNERLARERLLAGRAAAARLVGLKTAHASPAEALGEIASRLDALPRPFDAVVLGMGADGHTASLFPGSKALVGSLGGDRACVQAVEGPGASARVTLALPTLLDARRLALLVTGEEKLAVLARAEAGDDPLDLPIRAMLQATGPPLHVYWSP